MKTLEIPIVLLIVLIYFGVLIYEFTQYFFLTLQLSYKLSPFLL